MTEVGWSPKVGILHEMEKNMQIGFSGPIEISYTFFGDCYWEVQMRKMR